MTWAWREEYGGNIIRSAEEARRLLQTGTESASPMDEGCSKAVQEVFMPPAMKKGYIYKGSRIINWCPVCQTSISDAEVEHVEQAGHFWHINYPIVGQ